MDKTKNNELHLVTQNGDQCILWRSNQLTYIAQNRKELPLILARKFGRLATKLDLSYNTLTSYRNINLFVNLNELILDNNNLEDDHLEFKQNLRLKTLSLNKNKLSNLEQLINTIEVCFPNLEFLSLIGNPLCPARTEAKQNHDANIPVQRQDFEYQKYRYFVIYHLPNLLFLDSSPISEREREEALRGGYWLAARKEPASSQSESSMDSSSQSDQVKLEESFKQIALYNGDSSSPQTNGGYLRGNHQVTRINSGSHSSIRDERLISSYHELSPKGATIARLSYKYLTSGAAGTSTGSRGFGGNGSGTSSSKQSKQQQSSRKNPG